MANPVRYPAGVTTVGATHPARNTLVPYPGKTHDYFQEFDTYTAADWTVTEVGIATQALADEDGGVLLITNAAADDDSSFQQKLGESFKFESGKKLYFEARFKVSDATQSDFVMGLQITDTTPLDVTDGVFFQKDDGDANLDFHVEKDNAATSASAIATVANDTYLIVAFEYDGASKIIYSVNGANIGSSVTTNMPDDEELTISFGIQNGEAVAKTMSVDYIWVSKER